MYRMPTSKCGFPGVLNNVVVAAGNSIFNRTNKVNLGKLMADTAAADCRVQLRCQLMEDEADTKIAEIVARLKQ